MTPEIAALKAAYEANKVEVQSALSNLIGKINDLTTQLANVPAIDPAITDLTNEILADTTAIHTSQNPPAPVVEPTPSV